MTGRDRIALVRLSQFTPGFALVGPGPLDRAALEAYLARLAVEIPHPKTRSAEIGCVTGFLHALRQHRWASLPAEAQLYPSDHPRRDETPAPRMIPEFVMHQLEQRLAALAEQFDLHAPYSSTVIGWAATETHRELIDEQLPRTIERPNRCMRVLPAAPSSAYSSRPLPSPHQR